MPGSAEKLESLGRHLAPDGDLNPCHRPEFRQAKRYFYAPNLPERSRFFPSLRSFVAGTMPTPLQAVCGRLSPFAARVETGARLLTAYAVSGPDATMFVPWWSITGRRCEIATFRTYRSRNHNSPRHPEYSQTRYSAFSRPPPRPLSRSRQPQRARRAQLPVKEVAVGTTAMAARECPVVRDSYPKNAEFPTEGRWTGTQWKGRVAARGSEFGLGGPRRMTMRLRRSPCDGPSR